MSTAVILLATLAFTVPGFQFAAIGQGVSCGNHWAQDCSKCLPPTRPGQGPNFCNGVCTWINDECVLASRNTGEAIFIFHTGNKTEVVDLDNPSCSRITADIPDQRQHPSIHLLNNEVIICGGANASFGWIDSCIVSSTPARGNWNHHSTLITRHKNSTNRRWIPDSNTMRMRHSGEVLGDEIYLVAGAGTAAAKTSDKFSNGKWEAGPDLPYYMNDGTCSVKTGPETMIVTGGDPYGERVVELNVTSGEWRRLPDMPEGKKFHGCTMYENYIIVTGSGGRSRGFNAKSTFLLDLNTEKWERIGDLEVGKLAPQLVTVNNRVVALGGRNMLNYFTEDEPNLDTVEELDTESFTWKTLDMKLKIADAHHRAVVMDRRFLCE